MLTPAAAGRRRPGRRRRDPPAVNRPSSCGGGPAAWGGHQNGRIPSNALCPVPTAPALQLECGAATAFDQLNTAFKAQFGQDIGITDGYRSYDEQVHCRLEKGSLCANPGTSNHGWGKAVDIGACCGINSGTGAGLRLAHRQRRPLRLEPPRVGPSRRLQTRTLALGIRRDLLGREEL